MSPQEGLFHPPGDFCALVIWRLSRSSAASQVREAAAGAYGELRRAGDIQAVLAFDAPLVSPTAEAGPPPLPRRGPQVRIPSTQAQVLVQLAARTRERLLWALRRTTAVVAGVLVPEEEVLSSRLGHADFSDARRAPSRDEIQHGAIIPSGPLAGSAWVLYLRIQRDTPRRPPSRVRVVRPDGEPPLPPSLDAGACRGVIRRSFPFRQAGEEGLAFLATSADPTRFHRALDALLGTPGTPPDALLSHATPVGGGLYLAPSRDWLQDVRGDALHEAAS